MHASRLVSTGSLVLLVLLSGCVAPDGNETFDGGSDATGTPTVSPTASQDKVSTPSPTPSASPEPSDPDPSGTPSADPTPEPETHTVSITTSTLKGAYYAPAEIEIAVGDRVTWENKDAAAHTATDVEEDGFDTGKIEGGKTSAPITFSQKGTFTYYCVYHPEMEHAKVVVS